MPDKHAVVVTVLRKLALMKYDDSNTRSIVKLVSKHFTDQLFSLRCCVCPYCGASFSSRVSAWKHVVMNRWCAKALERDVFEFLERCGYRHSF